MSKLELFLRNAAAVPSAYAKAAFVGNRGAGKSTYMLHLEHELEKAKLFTPVHIYLDESLETDCEYSDLLLWMVDEIARQFDLRKHPVDATELEKVATWFAEKSFERTTDWKKEIGLETQAEAKTTLGLPSIVSLQILGRLKSMIVGSETSRTSIRRHVQNYSRDLISRVNGFLDHAREVLKQAGKPARLLVVQDNLDRLRGSALRQVFDTGGHMLTDVRTDILYVAPLALTLAPFDLRAIFSHILTMPNVKVRQRDGQPHQAGIDGLLELVAKRLQIDLLFENKEAVRFLIEHSGGSVRDLIRLLDDAQLEAGADGKTAVDEASAQAAVKNLRVGFTRVLLPGSVYYPILAEVHRTKREFNVAAEVESPRRKSPPRASSSPNSSATAPCSNTTATTRGMTCIPPCATLRNSKMPAASPKKRKASAGRSEQSPAAVPPSTPTAAEHDRERRKLALFLRQTREFRLALALYNDLLARDAWIREWTQELAADGVRVLTLDLQEDQPRPRHTLFARVQALVQESGLKEGERLAVMVVNLEARVDYTPELALPNSPGMAFLETANLHRELFPRACPGALVVWMTESLERAFVRHAPDLWHWRSHVFDLRTRVESSAAFLVDKEGRALPSDDFRLHPTERLHRLEEELAGYRKAGMRHDEGRVLNAMGWARLDAGDARRARADFEAALKIACEIGDRHGEGAALGNLGIAYKNLGEVPKAIGFYEQRLAIAREIGDRRGENTALHNLALGLWLLGQRQEALARMEESLRLHQETADPWEPRVRAKLDEWRAEMAQGVADA